MNATYSGSFNALKSIWKTEGMRGFYRAYWPHQMAWVPFNGSYWAIYGQLKEATSHMEQTNAVTFSTEKQTKIRNETDSDLSLGERLMSVKTFKPQDLL